MEQRDDKGRFVKGNKVSPGRKPLRTEREYLEVTINAVSLGDWSKVVKKALTLAMEGDYQARRWLSDYLLGKPPQILELKGVEAQQLAEVLDLLKQRGIAASDLFNSMIAELAAEDVSVEHEDER